MQDSPQKPAFPGAIIANGKRVPCAVKVETWHVSGLSFPGRPTRKLTTMGIWHWTGGEGSVESFFSTMNDPDEPKSVHFWIDSDTRADGSATVYQFMDACRIGAHCRGVNDRSWGIEFKNRGTLKPVEKHARGVTREILRDTWCGGTHEYAMMTPSQIRSGLAITAAMCEAYGLPVDVPRGTDGRLLTRPMTRDEMLSFRGVAGHYHWPMNSGKLDPGPAPMRALEAFAVRLAQGIGCPL